MKAEDLTVSYARAVYEQAMDKWIKGLAELKDTLQANPAMLKELEDPAVPFSRKQQLLDPAVSKVLSGDIRNFVYVLLKDGNLNLLGDILGTLEHMVRHGPALKTAEVKTAVPLLEKEKAEFIRRLQATYGTELYVDFVVDPAVLGGAIVRVGDKIIDGSVAGKLKSIGEKIGGQAS